MSATWLSSGLAHIAAAERAVAAANAQARVARAAAYPSITLDSAQRVPDIATVRERSGAST